MIYKEHVFYKNQKMKGRIFWVCGHYYRTKCKVRCVTDLTGRIIRTSTLHNHPPPVDKILCIDNKMREVFSTFLSQHV